MLKYKLTDQNMQTRNGHQWELNVWHEATGDPVQDLCSDAWLHCYDSPLLAVLHNPIHANIKNPHLWEVEVDGDCKQDGQLKCGYRRMKLVRELPLPEVTIDQRVRYGILCALEVYAEPGFVAWADGWLSGINKAAAKAAGAATRAAGAAARAAEAAEAAQAAAWAAVWAAAEAAEAAWAAAWAAVWAAETNINLQALAERAVAE